MLAGVCLALLLGVEPQSAAEAERAAPVQTPESVKRIAAALAIPPRLQIHAPLPEPTFRVEVQQHPYFADRPFTWNFGGGGTSRSTPRPPSAGSGTPPLFQIDLLPIVRAAKRALQNP